MENIHVIETIMDRMNQGILYIDSDMRIQSCNKRAKEITGIMTSTHSSHEEGVINEGDIVILADNCIGDDDGDLSGRDLSLLNINDKGIQQNDMLVAAGVYKNSKIQPIYKYIREHQLSVPLKIDVTYLGFHLLSLIDNKKKETVIQVNNLVYKMDYFTSVGNMVVIDGKMGRIRFFQGKGYSIRRESAGELLRGKAFGSKNLDCSEIEVTGKGFLDLFDQSELTEKMSAVLHGDSEAITNRVYFINKLPFICTIIPWEDEERVAGIFLMIQEVDNLEKLLMSRNEIIKQLEEKQAGMPQSEYGFPQDAFDCFVGKSGKAMEVKYMAYKASQNKFNVIITGDSGTGKSQIAREIHNIGNPKSPFVEVNCNAIAPSLFESELFGYVGGAFTGARSDGKVGYFEAADGGTIFLDEIGEIPLDIQVKLLHVLQNKVIYRVGSSKPLKVDVRVIAATNRDLAVEVAKGNFRQDLYYRINVFPICIPPLRERKPDLYLLINQILNRLCHLYGMELKQFSGDALQTLLSYDWPGNVRELENVIERAVTLCESDIIYSEHLSLEESAGLETLKSQLAREEKRILETAIMKHNGDKGLVLEELDISKSQLYEKMKKYSL